MKIEMDHQDTKTPGGKRLRRPTVALALGGGGARGIAHLGVLEVLEEHHVPIDLIVGTSAGSLVSAGYALERDAKAWIERGMAYFRGEAFQRLGLKRGEPLDEGERSFIAAVWHYLRRGIAFSVLLRRTSVYPGQVLEAVVADMVPDKTFADTAIPLAIPVLDLTTGDEVVLTAGSLREAVVASCSLPGFFPPVRMGDRLYVDPGVVGSVPADVARRLGADVVIAVDIELPFNRRASEEDLSNGLEIMFRVEAVGSRRLKHAQLAQADIVVRPEFGDETWSDFRQLPSIVEQGRRAAEEKIGEIVGATQASPGPYGSE